MSECTIRILECCTSVYKLIVRDSITNRIRGSCDSHLYLIILQHISTYAAILVGDH